MAGAERLWASRRSSACREFHGKGSPCADPADSTVANRAFDRPCARGPKRVPLAVDAPRNPTGGRIEVPGPGPIRALAPGTRCVPRYDVPGFGREGLGRDRTMARRKKTATTSGRTAAETVTSMWLRRLSRAAAIQIWVCTWR